MSKRPKGPAGKLFAVLSSFGLSCTLLAFLFVLTLLGTLEQVDHGIYEVQKLYFESWYVVHRIGPVPLFLPGGQLCMWLLSLNLLLGGLVRIRKSWATAGIIVAHIGIVFMLVAGLVKLELGTDGGLTLEEGQVSDEFVSYVKWQVAVWDAAEVVDVDEWIVPHEDLFDCSGPVGRSFQEEGLPFELHLSHFVRNGRVMPKGPNWNAASPVVEGFALLERKLDDKAEFNVPGLHAVAVDKETGERHAGLICGLENYPWTFESGGRTWAVTVRKERYSMPFAIRLENFIKEDHAGMTMAKSFKSEVVKIEDGQEQQILIWMNHPLRRGGHVLYQADFGPKDGQVGPPYSHFAVKRDVSDKWPEYACWVIAAGLLFAFCRRLYLYTVRQSRARAKAAVAAAEE